MAHAKAPVEKTIRICATVLVYETDPKHTKLQNMIGSAHKAGVTEWSIAVDKKSVRGTAAWLRSRVRGNVFEREWTDDFSAARNAALAAVPEGAQWWTWIDSDDQIRMTVGKTLADVIASAPKDTELIFFPYDYERDEHGNITTDQVRGRLYRAERKWEWRDRVHEDAYPVGRDWSEVRLARSKDVVWWHDITDRVSSVERNLRLISLQMKDEPENARLYFHRANAYFAARDFASAIPDYETYITGSTWTEEKWSAMIHQAICYREIGMMERAQESDLRAQTLKPEWAESYFGLGETFTRMGQWDKAVHYGELGIEMVAKGGVADPTVFVNQAAYSFNPYTWLAVAYYNLGDSERSLACLEQAYKARPTGAIAQKIADLKFEIGRERIIGQGLNLVAGLLQRNEPLKAKAILENLPAGAAEESSDVKKAMDLVAKRIYHLYDSRANRQLLGEADKDITDPPPAEEVGEMFPRMAWVLRRLKCTGAKRVLELGSENAALALYLAANGIQVVGTDLDPRRVHDANWQAVKRDLLTTAYHKEAGKKLPVLERDSPVQFHYADALDLPQHILDLGPFDAVLAGEIIEHVLEPEKILEQAERASKRVIVTTPDGSYAGAQEVNPQHVRMWSQRELAAMINPRGRMDEVHKVSPGYPGQPNLVADYTAGESRTGAPVVIWCPRTALTWSPDSLREGGTGGSETAVIRLAEELARRGKRVTVYAEVEGVWNGVRYAHTEDFHPFPCEAFIAWRNPTVIRQMRGVADKMFLWAHDVGFANTPTEHDLADATVIALSEWHKKDTAQRYPGAKIEVVGNGIDPERFAGTETRQKHRLIYAQSPDRGLEYLLDHFPELRKTYPDITLDVYYGFDLARAADPMFVSRTLAAAKQPGVTVHGRIDQDELAREYMRSDVLLYPSSLPDGSPFTETYCISVVEAQAGGCIPITPSRGALAETNACGIKTDDLIGALRDFWSKDRPEMRERAREWALQQTWEKVADGWLRLIEAPPDEIQEAITEAIAA